MSHDITGGNECPKQAGIWFTRYAVVLGIACVNLFFIIDGSIKKIVSLYVEQIGAQSTQVIYGAVIAQKRKGKKGGKKRKKRTPRGSCIYSCSPGADPAQRHVPVMRPRVLLSGPGWRGGPARPGLRSGLSVVII